MKPNKTIVTSLLKQKILYFLKKCDVKHWHGLPPKESHAYARTPDDYSQGTSGLRDVDRRGDKLLAGPFWSMLFCISIKG